MNTIQNKKISIVGGGPGGLTLARLLQLQGADVKVYERDLNKDARMQGATLDLHDESGLKAIRAAGLWNDFVANYRPGADRLRIIDQHANILAEDDVNKEGEFLRPEIDRGPLQTILLNSLQPGTVVWDSHIVALTKQDASWQLEFKNGSTEVADIVIAADGANSKIRPYVTPVKPFYSGITALEGAVYHSEVASPVMHKLLNGGKIFAFGDERTLIVSSKGDGSLVFYTSSKKPENWVRECGINFTDKLQVLAWFKQEYAEWADVWQELFENASAAFVPRPIYCMPLGQTWEAQANITLLGDAAHLMPPFAGEGVNMAMLDAYELARCLTNANFDNAHDAIAAYETEMRQRASAAAKDSLESGEAMHSPGAIEFMNRIVG
jgi:2-polyprenyl-6-methoxyphenol hydroxylase-like FAD-dependent oxidoreductase